MNPVASTLYDEDEWVTCNDDGFIYKRKRRRLDGPSSLLADKPAINPVEEKRQIERRRRTLLKALMERYQRELDEWEKLTNALSEWREVAQRRQIQQQQQRQQRQEDRTVGSSGSSLNCEGKNGSDSPIHEHLAQVEIQEAIISDLSNICDIAEAMCDAEEDRLKQSYFDLPIWASPLDLLASLVDQ